MELILKQTIDNLGEVGDIVKVKPGYARNYLIPQGLAVAATQAALARLEQEKHVIEARKQQQREAAEALAKQLGGALVTIEKKVGDENKLYGSVTSTDIAEKLKELGIEVDRKKILLDEPIKTVGETMVPVKVGYQMTTEVKVEIIPEAA